MKKTNDIKNLAEQRIENARKNLAKVINLIESLNMDVKSACSLMEWNDEVAYQIDDAATKLGYALATLTTWNDFDEDSCKDEHI